MAVQNARFSPSDKAMISLPVHVRSCDGLNVRPRTFSTGMWSAEAVSKRTMRPMRQSSNDAPVLQFARSFAQLSLLSIRRIIDVIISLSAAPASRERKPTFTSRQQAEQSVC